MKAQYDHFTLTITKDQARQGAHAGDCSADIKDLLQVPSIARQFRKISPDDIRAELKEYGAWDDTELSDDQANRMRILWLACGDILHPNG